MKAATAFIPLVVGRRRYEWVVLARLQTQKLHRINNAGESVGFYETVSGTHGFLYDGGSFSALDVPGRGSTAPHAVWMLIPPLSPVRWPRPDSLSQWAALTPTSGLSL